MPVLTPVLPGCSPSPQARAAADPDVLPVVFVRPERGAFICGPDVLGAVERLGRDFNTTFASDKATMPTPDISVRTNEGEEFRKDSIERDERRLAELGRRTVEVRRCARLLLLCRRQPRRSFFRFVCACHTVEQVFCMV